MQRFGFYEARERARALAYRRLFQRLIETEDDCAELTVPAVRRADARLEHVPLAAARSG